ncbi:hypothetical protein M758_UG201100 [Ceratodon purpureus]|nr:hypothetical protein M758_UG201100 [Ceratodon purpureus]
MSRRHFALSPSHLLVLFIKGTPLCECQSGAEKRASVGNVDTPARMIMDPNCLRQASSSIIAHSPSCKLVNPISSFVDV